MKVSQLYTYPIKSLRPCTASEAQLTRHGFKYDRRFMLLKVLEDGTNHNMHISEFNEMALFTTSIVHPSSTITGHIKVTFNPPGMKTSSIAVPLQPDVTALSKLSIEMHGSPTQAYKMDEATNSWFSKCFGYEVVLIYLGGHHRDVLMSTTSPQQASSGWYGTFTNAAASLLGQTNREKTTFADCAPYLVVSERSLDDVHARLGGELMDVTKFRPNIVIADAENPWDEDYWGQLTINGDTKIDCIHNCVRCVSLNVDYATGKPGTTASGKVLARLQKDRRVDTGSKYSPVFGRYSFLDPGSEGHKIRIGDSVAVSRKNAERTVFDWPGL